MTFKIFILTQDAVKIFDLMIYISDILGTFIKSRNYLKSSHASFIVV